LLVVSLELELFSGLLFPAPVDLKVGRN